MCTYILCTYVCCTLGSTVIYQVYELYARMHVRVRTYVVCLHGLLVCRFRPSARPPGEEASHNPFFYAILFWGENSFRKATTAQRFGKQEGYYAVSRPSVSPSQYTCMHNLLGTSVKILHHTEEQHVYSYINNPINVLATLRTWCDPAACVNIVASYFIERFVFESILPGGGNCSGGCGRGSCGLWPF